MGSIESEGFLVAVLGVRPSAAMSVQIAEMPDGGTYLSIARAITKPASGYRAPRSHFAIAIGCELSQAGGMVYGDGLDTASPGLRTPVGSSCRGCRRSDCAQRAFPTLLELEGD